MLCSLHRTTGGRSAAAIDCSLERQPFFFRLGKLTASCIDYAGRAIGGLIVPAECPPLDAALQSPCPLCSGCDWQLGEQPPEPVTVFLPSGVVSTTFPEYRCHSSAGCRGRLEADGVEYALLRKSRLWAVSHELLYHWGDKTSVGGAPWFGFWRDTINKFKGCARA